MSRQGKPAKDSPLIGGAGEDFAAPGGTLGLIAGAGELPGIIAAEARGRGLRVVVAALRGLAPESLEAAADAFEWFNVGKVGAIIRYLKGGGARGVLLAGKVPKTLLYSGWKGLRPDLRAVGMLLKLKDRRDDSILKAIDREFQKEGMKVLDMKELIPGLLTPEGRLTSKGPGRKEDADIAFGFRMAREIGRLDIGQTVVVKEKAVMAVEAIEGTDEAIARGGTLAGGGAVVVKASRPGQDMRFDIPVVGMDTLDVMQRASCRVLALEAGSSIIIDREEFIRRADRAGITVVGVRADLPEDEGVK